MTALCGCGDATGSLVGGDSLTTGGTGATDSDGGGGGAGSDGGIQYFSTTAPCAPSPGSDDTWSYLYGCYFGPSGVASCTFTSGCHGGGPNDTGTQISGYTCGADKTACWTSMTSALIAGETNYASTVLGGALRTSPTMGTMPLQPANVIFESGDIARLSAWVAAGAKND
jgi:hypothetical protein